MPREVSDMKEFIQLSTNARECRVRRSGKHVKLKLRTPKELFTIKLEANKAEEVIKNIECEIIEV